MTKVDQLNEQVEATRKEMYEAYKKNPNDPYVLQLSQSLDRQLNELAHAKKEHSQKSISQNL